MDQENTEPSSSLESKKKTRGLTTCKKLKEKFVNKKLEYSVDFDRYGDPIGEWAQKFKSYIGSVVRLRVDINIESWDVVSEGLKNMIWEDIKSKWKLKDDVRRKQVMETASKIWRDFKTRLISRFLRECKDPCEIYDFITKEKWEKIKKTRESEEFKQKSEKAKENQKLNKHPHFLGKSGYAAKRAKWLVDDPLASLNTSESIDPSIISDERTGRSYDWVRARTKEKEGGGYYIPTEQFTLLCCVDSFSTWGHPHEKILPFEIRTPYVIASPVSSTNYSINSGCL